MFRQKLAHFLEAAPFQRFIVVLIVINSVTIGLETSPEYMDRFGHLIDEIDLIILGLFVIEMVLKLYAFGWSFFRNAWNLFDSVVIIISVVPSIGASWAVLRALRIIRTLRLLNNIPKLRLIIESLLYAIPSIAWITVLLLIIFYIFAIIGNNLFGADFPTYFGSFSSSLFSLFQIMTLESWASGIARPVISQFPFASIYFVVFILIATYTTLNLFIAIVVNTMNEIHQRELAQEEENLKLFMRQENEQLKAEIGDLKSEMQDLKANLLAIRSVLEGQEVPKSDSIQP